jgi:polyisoprenoid-binding protein YceI
MRRTLLTAVVVALSAPAFAESSNTWDLDPAHSAANFSIKHMMVSNVHGTFQKVSGTVTLDEKNLKQSNVEATIDVASLSTGVEKRDGHLKSPDFFDVAKFSTMTFKSTSVAKAGANKFKVVGDLTMHGVTKPVTLAVTATAAVKDMMAPAMRRGIEATTVIHRKDFGLSWNKALESGGVLVGEDVNVTIDAELVSHTEKASTQANSGPAAGTAAPAVAPKK